MKVKLAGLTPESIVDGKGLRYTVFTQGCPHHCKGCHNPESWSFDGGEEKDADEIFAEFAENPLLKGITFSGGEPFCQPEALTALAKKIHNLGKDVTVFSGYTYEELTAMKDPKIDALLLETDVLVDGPYVEAQRNLTLLFRGSENQLLIDLNKTRETGEITLISDN